MDRNEVAARVRKVVAEMTGAKVETLKDTTTFKKDLRMESVKSIELIAAFEDEFDLEMDEEKAGAVQNVGGAVDFIISQLKK